MFLCVFVLKPFLKHCVRPRRFPALKKTLFSPWQLVVYIMTRLFRGPRRYYLNIFSSSCRQKSEPDNFILVLVKNIAQPVKLESRLTG